MLVGWIWEISGDWEETSISEAASSGKCFLRVSTWRLWSRRGKGGIFYWQLKLVMCKIFEGMQGNREQLCLGTRKGHCWMCGLSCSWKLKIEGHMEKVAFGYVMASESLKRAQERWKYSSVAAEIKACSLQRLTDWQTFIQVNQRKKRGEMKAKYKRPGQSRES